MEIRLNPPDPDEIEISLFGPGFGESVIVHTGDNNWVVIDSCISSDLRTPVALKYLEDLQIDPSTSIKQIIATHWHDDHMRGLTKIVEQSLSSSFVCSAALKTRDFGTLVELYGNRTLMGLTSGIEEFSGILKLLLSRNQRPLLAGANQCLWRSKPSYSGSGSECTVYSLSPSSASMLLSYLEISSLIPKEGTFLTRIPRISPNNTSVVIWIDFGVSKALLGADLEVTNNPETGWAAIINSSTRPSGKASVFKIPHHGSMNADHPDIWSLLLINNPHVALSPFSKGKVLLPQASDQARICSKTSNAFITSPSATKSPIKRSNVVEKQIKESVRSIKQVKYSTGHIRFRAKSTSVPLVWNTDLFGEATSICAS